MDRSERLVGGATVLVGHLAELFDELFDDAVMFPPADTPVPAAAASHLRHRAAWYSEMVGPLVCLAGRLPALDRAVAATGAKRVDVAVVVPDGLDSVAAMVELGRRCRRLAIRSLEVPLGAHRLGQALRTLQPFVGRLRVFLEIESSSLTERSAHELARAGLGLKLRTGGTTIDPFRPEEVLARPIVLCAAELLSFKCAAGLHHAVRHRDRETAFERHGFLNIALAARVAASSGSVAATREVLTERDTAVVARTIADLDPQNVRAIRALFSCFGTHSIGDPVNDLIAMGLASAGSPG